MQLTQSTLAAEKVELWEPGSRIDPNERMIGLGILIMSNISILMARGQGRGFAL